MNRILVSGMALLQLSAGGTMLNLSQPLAAIARSANAIPQKPLTPNIQKALQYLVGQQDKSGGWSEGEESKYMHAAGKNNLEVPNVADTCMSVLALIRAGNYPNTGQYARNAERAILFICQSIERSDATSLKVTDITGTRVQQKLGPHIDTFLASMTLSEVRNRMPDAEGNKRVGAALDKVIAKIERNQNQQGTWGGSGWAPIHSQALATKGLNRAKQVGAKVDAGVLQRAEVYAKSGFDAGRRDFRMDGAASVPLYAAGATLGGMQDSINTNKQDKRKWSQIASSKSSTDSERKAAEGQLRRFAETEAAQQQAVEAVTSRLGDSKFVQGFGCNGGEEFLSYLHISETLLANNSSKWTDWDSKIITNLNKVQGPDGTWMGQHCITSRTFCTAAALLVLMADRSPVNIAGIEETGHQQVAGR